MNEPTGSQRVIVGGRRKAIVAEPSYRHIEAFCHMKYQTDDGSETEWIWNSRDGVTPFVVHSRSGKEMKHVDWHLDRRDPDYQPKPGDRIFVDLTTEKALGYAREFVAKHWTYQDPHWPQTPPMSARYESQEAAIAELAADMTKKPGQPDLVEVPTVDGLVLAQPEEPSKPALPMEERLEIVPGLLYGRPLLSPNGARLSSTQQLSDEERRLAKLREKRRSQRRRRRKGQRRG